MFDSVWVLDQAPSSRLTRAELAAGVLGAHVLTLAALVAAQNWRIDPVPLPSFVAPPFTENVPLAFEPAPVPTPSAPSRAAAPLRATPAQAATAQPAPPEQLAAAPIPSASTADLSIALPVAGDGSGTGVAQGDSGNSMGGTGDETIIVWNPDLMRPVVVHRIDPIYPRLAQLRHRSGVVHLRAEISSSGEVRGLELVDASPSGLGFEKSALDAVRQWRFRPATTRDGRAVAVRYLLQVTFTIQ